MEGKSTRLHYWPLIALILLVAFHVLNHVDRNAIASFAPLITHDLQMTDVQYGVLTGPVFVIFYAATALVSGLIADRFNRWRAISIGLFVWSACTAASGLAASYGQMVSARALVAIGEASLVPSAVALIVDLVPEKRRATAIGVFFMGIPLGAGASYLVASVLGPELGWRKTFLILGVLGIVAAACIAPLKDRRHLTGDRDAIEADGIGNQIRELFAFVGRESAVLLALLGLVLVHFYFAGASFGQLWLTRERGFQASESARLTGLLLITAGTAGAVLGGVLADRFARRVKNGHILFAGLLVALCAPLIACYRLLDPASPLFIAGMAATFFVAMGIYGPVFFSLQAMMPQRLRSSIAGLCMLSINIGALGLGTYGIGLLSDRLASSGTPMPLSKVLMGSDLIAASAALCFVLSWISTRRASSSAAETLH